MTITFIGHGYVGLVTASVFADLGNTVWVIGHTKEKIEKLKRGIIPIYEPGLEEIVKKNVRAKRIFFTLDYRDAIPESSAVFIAVGTPPKENGEADLSTIFEVAKKLVPYLNGYTVIATKSTVPVGTSQRIKEIINQYKAQKADFDVASVPEFLREGQAIYDTQSPDRVVIGTDSKKAEDLLVELHEPIDGKYVLTNIETAEMIKYAANAFLATKISFANSIASLSELTGADGLKVLEAVGLDKRIGSSFLSPGAGFGGSCLPKDIKALLSIAKTSGYDFGLLKEVDKVNNQAMKGIVSKSKRLLEGSLENKTIAVLGLSFKPDTDDMRDAPSIVVINSLIRAGAMIKAYDPVAMENAGKILKGITFSKDCYQAVEDADLLIILTEWNEFRQLPLLEIKKLMRKLNIVDGRNIYDPKKVREMGFSYLGVGR